MAKHCDKRVERTDCQRILPLAIRKAAARTDCSGTDSLPGFHASHVSAHLDEEESRIRRGSAYVCEQMVSSCLPSESKLCFATSRKVNRIDDRESCLHARAVLACVPVCGSA